MSWIHNLSCPVCEHKMSVEFLTKDFFCPQCDTLLTLEHDYSGEDYDLSVWLTTVNRYTQVNK